MGGGGGGGAGGAGMNGEAADRLKMVRTAICLKHRLTSGFKSTSRDISLGDGKQI